MIGQFPQDYYPTQRIKPVKKRRGKFYASLFVLGLIIGVAAGWRGHMIALELGITEQRQEQLEPLGGLDGIQEYREDK